MATGVCVLLSVVVGVCVAFNLDTSFPLLKTGEDGSLFGLSVALHQDLRTDGYLLLVGAPREKAEPNVPANRTGGVYGCPINADQSDCRRIPLIDSDLEPETMVEDMWLGVSVASQGRPGGRILACGHRFVKLYGAFKLRHMIGQCYVRGNDLQYDVNDRHWQDPDQPCDHQGDVSKEVMCNMGISASITQTEIIVGSPGSYDWRGNVHILWKNPNDEFDTREAVLPNLDHRNIYIGYSVTQAARLLSKDAETVVTGAPKLSNEDARGSVLLVAKELSKLTIQQTLRGQQTGSYFGNAVAAVDLDNNGWNDLLVGAPFYFEREQEKGGAVYVYMNAGGRFLSEHSEKLEGPAGSAFGMTIAAAGDLNQDGFKDFAVGAPFHETGSVMIFSGSSSGTSKKPSQVIKGSSVSPRFRTFGYSISGGLDVDGNNYPDLLVGSLDDTVALLRSRPVIHLNNTIRASPYIVDPSNCNFCIQVEVCFSYLFSTGGKSDRDNITVHFTVFADGNSSKSRLRFRDNGQSVYSGFLSMPKKHCETLSVGLLSPIHNKVDPLKFSLNFSLYEKLPENKNAVQDLKHFPVLSQRAQSNRTEIHIHKACGSDNRCQSNLQMAAQFTDKDHKPFPKEEGTQVLHYNASITDLLLEVSVSNTPSPGRQAEDAYNADLKMTIPPSLLYAGVRTQPNDTIVECSTKDTDLVCELGNPFRGNHQMKVFIAFQSSEISLDTRGIWSLMQLSTHSEQSDLAPVNVSMLVRYTVQTSLILNGSPSRTSFDGHVIGESAMKKTEDVGSLLLFVLEVHIQGKPLGHLGNLEVEFNWPSETTNGKWLLYLTEIQVNGTSEDHCAPPGNVVNPLNLAMSEGEKRKMRRSLREEEVDRNDEQKKKFTSAELRVPLEPTTLGCDKGAKCTRFVCPLVNMNNSAYLTIRARLWNSTMIEDYRDAQRVTVQGQVTLKLRTNKPTINIQNQSLLIEVQADPELALQADSSVPKWIIVLSVLAGVLLLAVISLLLWKCGFFKRASTREMYEAKTQKAHMKSQPSEKDRLTEEL